ncbi:hypothetical protein GCM10027160_37860 [Streptomyces calidiresistens]|uniref:Uncharacterized protein n=1 Tax=Streptomyces calidiresistens TaxID=1485586 RepID=A0A7W3T2J1_9ACTN|nr:hypothetical protein [Streptomyces calidiresistens]MBB0229681.1 hypothetical protein [Streptomyces calidiresistens]
MTSSEMTVGELIARLSACDRSAVVRQAMNPFFPMAHRLDQVLQATDGAGRPVVYLAEGPEVDTRLGHLPPEVAVALTWQEPVQPSPRRRRRTAGGW